MRVHRLCPSTVRHSSSAVIFFHILLILLQSALQLLVGFWPAQLVVEPSQQESFYRVLLPAARQTPNLEDQWLERSNSRHKAPPASETTRENPSSGKVELWAINGREVCRKWRLPRHFWVLSHAVILRHGTDGFTSPPKEGALRIFSPWKIRRLRPRLNPRTWVPKASTLPPHHRRKIWD